MLIVVVYVGSSLSLPIRAFAKRGVSNRFSGQVGMPGSESRRPHSRLSPEEQRQLSFQAVMAPLPAEIPWPLRIAARRSALPPPRDSMSLGASVGDSGMSVGEIAPTWYGRLDAAPQRLNGHVRYFHTDAAGTPANDVSNSDVSNSRGGMRGQWRRRGRRLLRVARTGTGAMAVRCGLS